jgi:predicted MFS family arabinose efflux permease
VAQFLPMMITSPLGGDLADRLPRRTLLLVTQAAMALNAVVLWLAWVDGLAAPQALLVFVAVYAILNGLNIPSWQALVNDMVPREDLLSAVTLNSAQFNASRAIGPAIAGLLLATLGAGWTLGLNVLSFAFVIVALLLVRAGRTRPRPHGVRGVFRTFPAAVAYAVRRQPGILTSIVASLLLGLLANPVFTFTIVFADAVYDVGPAALGLLNVALGVGAVAVAVVLARGSGRWRLSRAALVAMIAAGAFQVVFGASSTYVVGLVALVGVGAGILALTATVQTATQTIVADSMRGRVMAFRVMLLTLSFAVGGLAQGAIAKVIGAQWTVAAAGVLVVVSALVLARGVGPIRLSTLDDPHDAPGTG